MPAAVHPSRRDRAHRILGALSLASALLGSACAGSEKPEAAAGSNAPSGTSNASGSSAGRPLSGSAAPAAGSGGNGAINTPSAGNSSAMPSAGKSAAGSGAAPGSAGAPAAGSTQGAPPPKDCNGKPMPARALGPQGPFEVGPKSAGLPEYWPTDAWKTEAPDKLGFDPAKLMAAGDFKTQYSNTQAMFIVRHGYVALEKYSGSWTATMQHESYSMAKSFASGAIGIAIAEGKIKSTDDKLCESYPMQWDCTDMSDPRSRITIEHSMNLMTGLMWREDWRSTATGTNDAYNPNLLDTVLARKASEEPGKTKRYSTGDPALLSGALQRGTGMTALAYAKQKIFDVIGIPNVRWNMDSKGRTTTYAGLQASAREYAKYGYLYLNRGMWDGKQVIPSEWIDRTTQAKNLCDDWVQFLWHVNLPVRMGTQDPSCPTMFCPPTEFANLPHDGYFAAGVNGQLVFVIPSADLVIVRLASDQAGSEHWDEYARGMVSAVLDAIVK